MNRTTEKLISIVINIFTLGIYGVVELATHHGMVKGDVDCEYLKKASFADFEREFKKRRWVVHRPWMSSLFCGDRRDGYLHADIFRFNNVGYLMTSYGLMRARRLIRREVRKRIMKPYIDQ